MGSKKQDISKKYIQRIAEIKDYINGHYTNLDVHALWLFVATLGSWSIDNPYIQLLSMVIIFFLFFSLVFDNHKDLRPFKEVLTELEQEIKDSPLTGDAEKARYHEISEIKRQLLGFKSVIYLTPKFLVCYSFWGLSLLCYCLRL